MKHRRYRQGVLVVHAKKRNPLKYDPSRTGALRNAFVKELRKRFAKLKLALSKLIVGENALGLQENPKKSVVGNQATSVGCRALRLIEVPDIRQRNHWECGAAATFAVTQYFHVGAKTLDQTVRILGTNVQQSTHPLAIVRYLQSLGLFVEARQHLTVADLAAYHARGFPVIVCLQDYNDRREPGALLDYGHYLVVTGVGYGMVFAQDSSIENLKLTPGGDVPKSREQEADISAPGRIMVYEKDWMRAWFDRDIDGNEFARFGIAVGPPGAPPGDTAGTAHDLLGGVVPATNTHRDRLQALLDNPFTLSWEERQGEGPLTANLAKECPLDPDECEDEQEVEGSATVTKGTGGKAHSLILDNTRWKFTTDADKLKRFAEWLRKEFGKDLTSPDTEELWRRYCEDGFRKGAGRAFDDTRKAQRALAAGDQAQMDFYAGNRDEFLRSSFGRPETVEKVQLLAARSFSELDGVTDAMEQRMTRVLADGLVQGKGPKEIARDLDDEVDLGRKRAEVIARTELIRAHAEGQLDAMENLGVEEVGAAVEFTVTDDNVLCPECAALEGIVLKIEEARGLIPIHPG